MRTRARWLCLLSLLVAAGCGDDDDDDDVTTSDGGTTTDAATTTTDSGTTTPDGATTVIDASIANTVAISGIVTADDATGSASLGGASVSAVGVAPVVRTALDGSYTLRVPENMTVVVRVSGAGYRTRQRAITVATTDVTHDVSMISNMQFMQVETALSFTQDPLKGVVLVRFAGSDAAGGYGATLSAAHGASFAVTGTGPMTTTTTPANRRELIFPNVNSGTTTVVANPPSGKTCTPDVALANHRVDPDVFTDVVFNCN